MRTLRLVVALLCAATLFAAPVTTASARPHHRRARPRPHHACQHKEAGPRGEVPPCFDLPKEECWKTPPGYDQPPEEAGSTGRGSNRISFRYFDDGDIIVAIQSWSVGHAGIWDERYDRGTYSYCVWSAVKSSPGRVLREQPVKYRTYDRAYGLWVPRVSLRGRRAARSYAAAQNGEPYRIHSSKRDQSHWYCSKLVWAGYKYRTGVDLDANGGYWVSPVDLYNDRDTRVFAYGS